MAEYKAYAVHGSPGYCVSHAVLELAGRNINLCVSGINLGENVGLTTVVSGTVGAALEADSYDIPAIAASVEVQEGLPDWSASIHFLRSLAESVLSKGYQRDVAVWNLNIPAHATKDTTWKLTRQSRQNYFFFKRPVKRNKNEPFKLKVYIEIDESTIEKDSDIYCFAIEKHVSITPLTWDMTSECALDESRLDLD